MKLYIKQKLFSFSDQYSIYDEAGAPVFYVQGKVFSMGAKIRLYDMQDRELYYIEQKLLRFLPEYEIYQEGNLCARIKKEFSLLRPRLRMESALGEFAVQGDFWGMDFAISLSGRPIGSIQKAYFTFRDSYEMDIAHDADAPFFATLVIAIDHCLHNGDDNN